MDVSAKTIEEYFAATGERERDLRTLDALIKKHAPDLKPVLTNSGMTGQMLGYGMMAYKSSNPKYTEWPLVALASQKNYMALYVCAVIDGQYVAEKYAGKLGKVSLGRSCIRFKKLEDLNLETVKTILIDMNARYARGEKLFGH